MPERVRCGRKPSASHPSKSDGVRRVGAGKCSEEKIIKKQLVAKEDCCIGRVSCRFKGCMVYGLPSCL